MAAIVFLVSPICPTPLPKALATADISDSPGLLWAVNNAEVKGAKVKFILSALDRPPTLNFWIDARPPFLKLFVFFK